MYPSARRLAALAMAFGATVLVGGCHSVPPGEMTVSKSRLEESAAQLFRERIGGEPIEVTCPGGLRAVVSTTEDCQVITGANRRYQVVLTVIRANSPEDIAFDFRVGAEIPNLITADD